ncbi:TetR/AcrR family transcriptional regulator [Nonomuraea sp. NPDC000554]|uniref:TetR/AcrR family transcriptional regulator n=1 Tax=Nonomuraea sp. NPDC000554 TaxID=3154259 RepID=UPI0033303F44
MGVSARRGSPLSQEEIRSTALRMVDEGGVESLSMRKLAAALNVNPMSLYHHVESKEALIGTLCRLAGDELQLPPDDGSPWQDQLRSLALAYHAMASSHPALWVYVHNHPEIVADKQTGLWQVLHRILRAASVPEPELRRTGDVLHAFVAGFVFSETKGHLDPDHNQEEIDRTFDTAINLIIYGLSGR